MLRPVGLAGGLGLHGRLEIGLEKGGLPDELTFSYFSYE